MKELASLYARLLNPLLEKDQEIQLHLKYLSYLDVTVAYPFLVKIYYDYENQKINKQDFIQILDIVQSYIFRRYLLGLPSRSLDKVFMNLYRKIDPSKYVYSLHKTLSERSGDARFPTDAELHASLKERDIYNPKRKTQLNYLFTRLENHKRLKPIFLDEQKHLYLGRIFPEKYSEHWGKDLSEEEYDKMRQHSNTLANLAYSGCSDENVSFLHKREVCEHCYAISKLWTNQYLSQIEEFGPEELNQRYKILMDRFVEVWKPPMQIRIVEEQDFERKNILGIDSATGKKVEEAIWKNEPLRLKNESFTSLFVEVITKLIEEHEVEFLKQEQLCQELKLCKRNENCNFRAPVFINEYVIETKSSNDYKLKMIKKILGALNLDNVLYVRLYMPA
ncbi:MAG: HNH endonuclease family protein [Bacteroidia bacterium]|nr:HNH endonuclease family protein [Bacteroidia bacterium]MDW8158903.1 HNH endonuclease family protein [Bacteroidia bacterium]